MISRLLPQHHKDRIVLLTTSYTNATEVGKYVPHQHIPAHLRDGNRPDGPDPPEAPRSTKSEAVPRLSATATANGTAGAEPSPYPVKPVEID